MGRKVLKSSVLCIATFLLMIVMFGTTKVHATTIINEGNCGIVYSEEKNDIYNYGWNSGCNNATWTLDDEGTLTISGTGSIYFENAEPEYKFDCVKNIIINDGITRIYDFAFYAFTYLQSITIPNSVTYIGDYAFCYCADLTHINLPNGITYIGDSAFQGCESLPNITIPNSVTYIESFAFEGCSAVKKLTAVALTSNEYEGPDNPYSDLSPNTLEEVTFTGGTIGDDVFDGFKSLKKVTISKGVKSIDCVAFRDCTSLKKVTIQKGVKSIGGDIFTGCKSLKKVTIPNTVKSIGNGTFLDCKSLKKITIPKSVKSIGYFAFYGCTSLTNVTIPKSVKFIGQCAFYGCKSLKIPRTLKETRNIFTTYYSYAKSSNNIVYFSEGGMTLKRKGKTIITYHGGTSKKYKTTVTIY